MVSFTTVLGFAYLTEVVSFVFFLCNLFVIFVIIRRKIIGKLPYFRFVLAAIFGLAYGSGGIAFVMTIRISQIYQVPMFTNMTQLQCALYHFVPQTAMIYFQVRYFHVRHIPYRPKVGKNRTNLSFC